ncbi:PSD1 and planctomycete cytochrome C domain-containing protein [Urbifossiella limnaea]|uniref:Planctomycete cytochrome C n=1 Tax=Urbifossiella limnaea TaxID=2528023 RepID=A0A517XVE3_9BACT|nr:PSD1 and planctomycete cytochrome C domain-containing protein [Urbifossiella limnaea]QDU21457.1 Planctomycete cytochrome C [Urbifossiella limnaea]
MSTRLVVTLAALFAAAPAASAQPVDFNRDVRPILSNNCFACHGPDEKERKGDLRLDTKDGALGAIVPGNPAKSELLARVRSPEPSEVMPPAKSGKKLTPREIDILDRWVKQGGGYAPHWAYVPPTRPAVPATKHATSTPIDSFLFYRLEREGLNPQPDADRYALLRRVSLDLTGVPPTWAEAAEFARDNGKAAYERQVDRLLASPRFGEHWARLWLDLARYADSAGYADDPPRTIWKYRDYVIRAFNDNLPFDRFTVEQLAGDLLPNPTEDQLTATAFHRNTLTNNEGGTNDEEFRNVAVVDRVNTTFTVWMGTSIACAQCHTHKYDPLTQREFFGLFAFFNNTADADRSDESPLQEFWVPETREKRRRAEAEVASLETILKGVKADQLKADRDRLATLKKQLPELKPLATVPVLKELPQGQRRVTKLQFRGNFMDLGEVVTEGVPAALHPLPAGEKSRLTLAKWVVSKDNPLTARVVANRFWEQIFGTGLVRTSEEFGAQGELPSHPELLDWLAVELQSDWNVKRFLRLLVTSAAYRQSSKVTPALVERDPENRLLARGPRVRLSAEMVRDQALAAAGLLSPKVLGPSVKPPQPSLGLSAAFGRSIDWQPSTGEDRYRRGVYTEWRRSNPYPSMSTFDAPNRDACTVRRARTNTPLQALVTMNDPVYVEAAQGLARRVLREGGATPAERAAYAVRTALTRPPTDTEVARLVKLYTDARAAFDKDRGRAAQFATNPLGALPAGVDAADAAAWTTVASVLLNLDEMFMKR